MALGWYKVTEVDTEHPFASVAMIGYVLALSPVSTEGVKLTCPVPPVVKGIMIPLFPGVQVGLVVVMLDQDKAGGSVIVN